jgi:hypothetical protein
MLADYKLADSNAEGNPQQISKLRNTCKNAGKFLCGSHVSYPDARHKLDRARPSDGNSAQSRVKSDWSH